jgi:ribosome-binding protein aMBF1 (putative translation factor)
MTDDTAETTAGGGDVEPAAAQLAEEIRRRRLAADLSHAQLGAKIGYSRQYVSLAERPRKGLPSADLVPCPRPRPGLRRHAAQPA